MADPGRAGEDWELQGEQAGPQGQREMDLRAAFEEAVNRVAEAAWNSDYSESQATAAFMADDRVRVVLHDASLRRAPTQEPEPQDVGELPDGWTLLRPRFCVECPTCGFAFHTQHTTEDGDYVCPLCEPTQEEPVVPDGMVLVSREEWARMREALRDAEQVVPWMRGVVTLAVRGKSIRDLTEADEAARLLMDKIAAILSPQRR